MELEYKHLASYLPYELKYKECGGEISIMKPEDIEQILTHKGFIMPILRPLSDLLLPCLENGRIPIFELCDIERSETYWTESGNKQLEKYDTFSGQIVVLHDAYESIYSFGFHTELKMFYGEIKGTGELNIIKQLELFLKLFEWHFDVFNLIGNQLAIDINTLNIK